MSSEGTHRRLDAIDEKLERVHRESHATQRALELIAEAIQALVCKEREPQKLELTVRIVLERPGPCVYPKSTGGNITVIG